MTPDVMKRAVRSIATLCMASIITGCTNAPVVNNTQLIRHEPTRVRSLLIVVDDTLFSKSIDAEDGPRFARTLGATLKDNVGSIPVTLLQIDSFPDKSAVAKTILSSHATQVMWVRATHLTTRSSGGIDFATWQLTLSDVNITVWHEAEDPSKSHTRILTPVFYRDEVEGAVYGTLDLLVKGEDSGPQHLGMALADQLRKDRVIIPDDTSPPVAPRTSVPLKGNDSSS